MTAEPEIVVRLGDAERALAPGGTLAGDYEIPGLPPDELKAVEVSVLWHTEGKGDEDMTVHDFTRLDADEGVLLDPRRPTHFETVLPGGPLSYEGRIVKVRWCVRVRAFLRHGKDLLGEAYFRLGDVPPAGWTEPGGDGAVVSEPR